MPELPDILVYQRALEHRVVDTRLCACHIYNPFLLRTVLPLEGVTQQKVTAIRRIGKRLAFQFEKGPVMALHLMIAGRLQWYESAPKKQRKQLARWDFDRGTLVLTEQGSKRRAALHLFASWQEAQSLDRGGLDVLASDLKNFKQRLTAKNRTLKRLLTDPSCFDGIGNAFSDEILHAAQLSPFARSHALSDDAVQRLWSACRTTLSWWIEHLTQEAAGGFPKRVTAFRPEMAVHGRFGQACPSCANPVQRIRYAERECNYCPTCQTDGKLLADRALSRLLKDDWPKRWEDLERP